MTGSMDPIFSKHLVGVVLTVSALAGCATTASTPEATVRVRATQQWAAKVANDLDKAYEFMPPSYRAVTPRQGYKNSFAGAVQWQSSEVATVTCETADKCVALMKVEAKPVAVPGRRTNVPIVTYFDEVWVRENNQWWLFPTP